MCAYVTGIKKRNVARASILFFLFTYTIEHEKKKKQTKRERREKALYLQSPLTE